MQRSNSAVAVDVRDVDIGDVDDTKASTISTPPRMEPVTRTDREPAEAAPTAKSDTEAKSAAPSPERNVRWRPERMVAGIYRARPPRPRTAIREPTTVVIRSPAPRLIANPRPAVVGLVSPVAVAIRSPVHRIHSEPTHRRSRERSASGRRRRDPACRCIDGWCDARSSHRESCDRDRCSSDPNRRGREQTKSCTARNWRRRERSPFLRCELRCCPAEWQSALRPGARSRSCRRRAALQRGTRHHDARMNRDVRSIDLRLGLAVFRD